MEVIEKFCVPEPQWILDEGETGSLYWRRDPTGNNARVKFRCDVEVLEFSRGEHELEEIECPKKRSENNSIAAVSMTCLFCIAVTVLLPWYILGVN